MIEHVFKICGACVGDGTIDVYPNPNSSTSAPGLPVKQTCELCDGKGVVPSGLILFRESALDNGKSFAQQLEELPENENRIVKSLFSKSRL